MSDQRQSVLPGSEFETQSQPAEVRGKVSGSAGESLRDPRIHVFAKRVDEYERARYAQHPRCVRPKRATPEAIQISVEAVVRAFEWAIDRQPDWSLETIETRFRAVVELNWSAAESKVATWMWWNGGALWRACSLDRCLGWLEEERNSIFLARARGRLELPKRKEVKPSIAEVESVLSELDAICPRKIPPPEHAVVPPPKFATEKKPEPPNATELALIAREKASWEQHLAAMEAKLSKGTDVPLSILRGDAPSGLNDGVAQLGTKNAERDKYQRMKAYIDRTTPEQRAADDKAGRKLGEGES